MGFCASLVCIDAWRPGLLGLLVFFDVVGVFAFGPCVSDEFFARSCVCGCVLHLGFVFVGDCSA